MSLYKADGAGDQARDRANADVIRLGRAPRGLRGTVVGISVLRGAAASEGEELERRLLEIGFVDGASVEILHEGLIGRDPVAVRLDDMRVALRRREADAVLVRPLAGGDN
jgi:ferrous iron transport protein A